MRRILALATLLALTGCSAKPRQLLDVPVDYAAGVRWVLGDSRLAVQLLGRGAVVFDATTGDERAAWRKPALPQQAAYGIATSAAGETLAVAIEDSVLVLRTADATPIMTVAGGGRSLALSGDGSRLAWCDGTLARLVHVPDARTLYDRHMPSDRNALVWLERLGQFAATDTRRVVFLGVDSLPAGALDDFTVPEVGPLASSGSGATLVVGEGRDAWSVWDTVKRTRRWRAGFRGRDLYSRMALSADTWYLASVNGGEVTVRWAYTSKVVTRFTPHRGAEVRDLAFASSGHRLATLGADGHLRVWEIPAPPREKR